MFCKNCGKELKDDVGFCPFCGTAQNAGQQYTWQPGGQPNQQYQQMGGQYNNAGQDSSMKISKPKKSKLPVMIAVIVVIVVGLLYNLGNGTNNSNNYKETGLKADNSDNKGSIQGSTDVSDNNDSEQDSYKRITSTKISIDGKNCSNSEAAYTYEASYGDMFIVTCPFSNDTIMLTVAVPRNMCESGMSLSDKELRDKAVLDLCIIGETNSVEYDSVSTPDVFSDMYFEMGQYTQDKEAGFIVNTKFDYEGNTYSLEVSAVADYIEYQGNQGGTSENNQDQTCLYCYGSKKCYLCRGLGYTNWGGTQIDCNSCGGTGVCKYCGGTGISFY